MKMTIINGKFIDGENAPFNIFHVISKHNEDKSIKILIRVMRKGINVESISNSFSHAFSKEEISN